MHFKVLYQLRVLLPVFVSFFLSLPSAHAQIQYANKVVMEEGIVSDNTRAADGNLATNATIKPSLLLGYTRLRVSFPTTAAAGKEAGMYIKPNILISAALLGGATLNTFYKDGSTITPVDSHLLSSDLLNLKIEVSGIRRISFTPTQPFNQIELVFFSVLALGQDIEIYEAFSTAAPLPVVLTSFQAAATPAGVSLSWGTASEHAADQFVVERAAADAPGNFQAIGRVQAAGTSAQARTYQFVDAEATSAARRYYRLRQLDHDGTATFSPVVAVQAEALATRLLAYPSPTVGTLTVAGAAGSEFSILDQLGRPVRHATTSPSQPQLDVSSLPAGLYFVQDATTGQRAKFLKAN
ncbi:T9SS type A sorting domain-containing protein [Hymenobacter setariae]|uniref:T9SS type A sorting domain-containing protein n=1 Tax=Hymenobacter setariae TaxID=2594794 RepID=A0A558BMP1_9BACT|nr:T9SS type A sorting domain-containing protein [Hymenobacter setariae]TVT37772.1 T9SS type A sorting domain-containing protein [Hymenobacter setariae]